jgi:hypothetical protein
VEQHRESHDDRNDDQDNEKRPVAHGRQLTITRPRSGRTRRRCRRIAPGRRGRARAGR